MTAEEFVEKMKQGFESFIKDHRQEDDETTEEEWWEIYSFWTETFGVDGHV